MPSSDPTGIVLVRVRRYLRQAEILRQIHSDKAFRAERANRWYAVLTVLVAAVLTLLGFAGPERLATVFAPMVPIDVVFLHAALNWMILAIVVLAVLGLIYRFDERSAQHHHSIEKLTEFVRDVEDFAALGEAGQCAVSTTDLDAIRERYKGIAATLPPSTDREYLRSKKRYLAKKEKQTAAAEGSRPLSSPRQAQFIWPEMADAKAQEPLAAKLVTLLLDRDQSALLRAVRDELGESFWIVGGFVRDPVWDDFNGHSVPTPLEDVDVVYFDRKEDESKDAEHRRKLAGHYPNQNWSVVNEAHAHSRSGDAPYSSLVDAVARFPESASAVAVRLDARSNVHIVAPYGLTDLFGGVVRRSAEAPNDRFMDRLARKQWSRKWPKLAIDATTVDDTKVEAAG